MSVLAVTVVAFTAALAGPASAASSGAVLAENLTAVPALATSGVQEWGADSDVPAPVSGLGGEVTAIAAGAEHSLALLKNGTVMAWGGNESGQLGGQTGGL